MHSFLDIIQMIFTRTVQIKKVILPDYRFTFALKYFNTLQGENGKMKKNNPSSNYPPFNLKNNKKQFEYINIYLSSPER